MKESLKNLFAMLAGVDSSDIEIYAGEEDENTDDVYDEDEEDGCELPEFVQGATNVYRTKSYIVKQNVSLGHQGLESTTLISRDTYYVRTPKRDAMYESIFEGNKDLDGRRIPTMAYFRTYRA